MARMSIDDKICRDPRITVLATALGWSRRETVGCLVLDVWPICYDQESHLISERIIDAAAGRLGFAEAMVECELATRDRGGKIRINGAKERIEYLIHKRLAGRQGGLKSADSRAKYPKQTSSTGGSTPQAAGNPSASASASVTPTPINQNPPVANAPGEVMSPGLIETRTKTDLAIKAKAEAVPERAWKAADYLRDLVLGDDPKAAVGRSPWGEDVRTGTRLGWANGIRLMVERDERTYEEIADALRWVFTGQPVGAKFIVQSVDSLREKWDRIQAVRRNQAEKAANAKPQLPFAKIEEL